MNVVGDPRSTSSLIVPPCSTMNSRCVSPGGLVRKVGLENDPTGSNTSWFGAVVAPPLPTSSASAARPTTSATRPPRVPLIAGRIRASPGSTNLYPRSGDGFGDELLEARNELLALAKEPTLLDQARAHALLDALDERTVFRTDLPVELEQLVDPPWIGVRREEVVQEAGRALRTCGQKRADRDVRRARVGVQLEVRPDEVELRLALGAGRRELREDVGRAPLEAVLVRIDVVHGTEAFVRHRAVVALEVVLAGDLPVRRELVVVARVEDQTVDRDDLRHRAEHVRERERVLVRVHEQERPPGLEAHPDKGQTLEIELGLAIRARCGAERPVEVVRPRVIRALHRLSGALGVDEERAAVPADIEERAHAVLGPHDEHRDLARPGGEAVSYGLDLARVPDVLPGAAEDPLLLAAQHVRVGVPAPGQGLRHRGQSTPHRRRSAARATRVASRSPGDPTPPPLHVSTVTTKAPPSV